MGVLFEAGEVLLWHPSPHVAKLFLAQLRVVEGATGVPSGIGDLVADEVTVNTVVLHQFVSSIAHVPGPERSAEARMLYAPVFAISCGLLAASGVARPVLAEEPVVRLAEWGEQVVSRGAGPGHPAALGIQRLIDVADMPMSSERLRGLFYCIQFQRDPLLALDHAVGLFESDRIGLTVTEGLQRVDRALDSPEPVRRFDMSEFGFSEDTLRRFLAALRARLAARVADRDAP